MGSLRRKKKEARPDYKGLSENHQSPAKLKPPSQRYQNYDHPTEEQHRTAEQFNWRNNYTLNVFIAVAAGITVLFAFGSFYETRRQANIAADVDRAWINVGIDSSKISLTWKDGNPVMSGKSMTGINEGNSPALDVQLFGVIYIPRSQSTIADKAVTKSLCQGDENAGNMLFMKEQTESSRVESEFSIRASYNGKPIKTFSWILGLVVCSVYHVVGDSRFHHTTRVYDVGQKSSNAPLDTLGALNVNEDLLAPNVSLQREIDGEFAD